MKHEYQRFLYVITAMIMSGAIFSVPGQQSGNAVGQREFPSRYDRLGIQLGDPEAEIVVREFADYQCPACRSFFPTAKQLIQEYVHTGKVRFVLYDFPLNVHKNAVQAAEAARCAGLQDTYWPMHDALFEHQEEWAKSRDPITKFTAYAGQLGLDAAALRQCLDDGRTREAVLQSRSFAEQIGIRSTPTVIVGNTAVRGGIPWSQLQQLVEQKLSGEPDRQAAFASAEPMDPNRELKVVTSNRLSEASSPYLQLHADNPVDWYSWGEEAFARAREENKPIFLSIGYFTCYWCHVMERESFSNPEVADLLNRFFVAIKVDREQRPDVDSMYMRAVNVLGQRGGWPLSLFLTPELKPFFGATYFPRPQFLNALNQLRAIWAQQPERIHAAANQVIDALQQLERSTGISGAGEIPGEQYAAAAERSFARAYDEELGGFFEAPKFPQPSILLFLLDRHRSAGSEQALDMVTGTLDAMAKGGIWDHLGGGFHRYSTDARWRVPHFEKMLYDNAQLLEVYARAWKITGKTRYREIVDGIVRYIDTTLTAPDTGLLYSAQSSLVHELEGESYIWSQQQLQQALQDPLQIKVATLLYGLDGGPDVEGAHVLHQARSYAEVAGEIDSLSAADVEAMHAKIDAALLEARNRREQAPIDTKHVLSWNAMMVQALAYAGRVMQEPELIERASGIADAILSHMYNAEGGPWLAVRSGHGDGVQAQLSDYAALTNAMLELGRATGEERWQKHAARVASDMIRRLWNPDRGLFKRRADSGALLVETTDLQDGAEPAGNSVAAVVLTDLTRSGNPEFGPYAVTVLRAHEAVMNQSPISLPLMLTALETYRAADLPGTAAIPDGNIRTGRLARIAPGKDTAGGESPGLKLEGVGGGVAASGSGSLFSGDKVGMQLSRCKPRTLTVRLSVDDGWHINANPASLDFLIPTEVSVFAGNRLLPIETDFPAAARIAADQLGMGPIDVYGGEVEIATHLPAEAEQADDLRAVVRVQACNDEGRCLAPDELEAQVPGLDQ